MPVIDLHNFSDFQSYEKKDFFFDAIIIGSGPAGATVAYQLTQKGHAVAVLEEGPLVTQENFPDSSFQAMTKLYRDMSTSMILGNCPMPFVQAKMVGGASTINGAISWRLPLHVYHDWLNLDPGLKPHLPWDELQNIFNKIEHDLNIAPTDEKIAGPNNLLLKRGADLLKLENRPIYRNVKECEGLGRCLQGCPKGHKLSMENSYLRWALEKGCCLFPNLKARKIIVKNKQAVAVVATNASGDAVTLKVKNIIVAASAVQSPGLLLASGIKQGTVGKNFQCHPGISMAGHFATPVHVWRGATQGHEVIEFCTQGIKFEALGYDRTIVAMRLKGVGAELMQDITHLKNWANWGAAIKAQARGKVIPGRKRSQVLYSLTRDDLIKVRKAVRILGEMMLAAGATYVTPGVQGWHKKVTDPLAMSKFEEEVPLNPKLFTMAVTHMFGTCKMGSDPKNSVVRPDFRHHHISGLYVADSSVFPTNIGVNPQTSIIAMAHLCAKSVDSTTSN
ncbi:MAG: GMC family oxidoreductase [Bdellovibrio sp.]|nr:GMC family oxidoreductase [Bdellovibrio sp.]